MFVFLIFFYENKGTRKRERKRRRRRRRRMKERKTSLLSCVMSVGRETKSKKGKFVNVFVKWDRET